MSEVNERYEERILEEQRQKVLKSAKQPVTNSFLRHILDSNEDDFISEPIPDPDQANCRFAEHQSNLRKRDRGSMNRTKENYFIKEEPKEEIRMEEEPIEQIQPEPEPEPDQEPESEPQEQNIEENTVEFLKELADKAINVIETNNLNVEQEFIDMYKKYVDLLIYYDFIDVNQSDLLNGIFKQIEEANEEQNIDSNPQQLPMIDTSFIKTERIYE